MTTINISNMNRMLASSVRGTTYLTKTNVKQLENNHLSTMLAVMLKTTQGDDHFGSNGLEDMITSTGVILQILLNRRVGKKVNVTFQDRPVSGRGEKSADELAADLAASNRLKVEKAKADKQKKKKDALLKLKKDVAAAEKAEDAKKLLRAKEDTAAALKKKQQAEKLALLEADDDSEDGGDTPGVSTVAEAVAALKQVIDIDDASRLLYLTISASRLPARIKANGDTVVGTKRFEQLVALTKEVGAKSTAIGNSVRKEREAKVLQEAAEQEQVPDPEPELQQDEFIQSPDTLEGDYNAEVVAAQLEAARKAEADAVAEAAAEDQGTGGDDDNELELDPDAPEEGGLSDDEDFGDADEDVGN